MANQITVYLDPAQMPARTQDQQTFDSLWASLIANLPTFGAQFNAGVANFNAAAAGGAYAIPYTIDLSGTSDIDPGSGKLRFDNATQNLATTLRLDLLGTGGVDYTAMIDTFDASTSSVKGQIRIVKQGDLTKFLMFDVTARTAPTGYRDISVTPRGATSANPFVNGDAVLLFFQRAGDKGDAGSLTGVLWVRDEKASGQDGGTAAAGSYSVRTLNTTKKNSIVGASVASNQITLPAGTYRLDASAPAYNVGPHQLWLYNATDAVIHTVGTSESSPSTAPTRSRIEKIEFTLASQKTFELRHFTNTGIASSGLGIHTSSGQVEVFTEVFVEKVS